MEKAVDLMNNLLPEIDAFLQSGKPGEEKSLESFTLWLNRKLLGKEKAAPRAGEHSPSLEEIGQIHKNIDMQITFLLFQLARHVKSYLKIVLSEIDLVGLDDYHFLLTLLLHGSMTKSEVIHANGVEFSSGIEVIKRLLRGGYIEEYDDPDDRRSRRVIITGDGKKKVEESMNEIEKVSKLFPGSLDDEHKIKLLAILAQLRDFHRELAEMHSSDSLDEMLKNIHRHS